MATVAVWLVLAICTTDQSARAEIGPAVSSDEEGHALALFQARAARYRQETEERVGAVGARLLRTMPLDTPISFQLLNSSEVNAYSRGSIVRVTLGMIRFARTDGELALVLAHELGHLVADRESGASRSSPGDRERIADYQGLMALYRAGYEILAAPEIWQRMATELVIQPISQQAPGASHCSSSHPSFAERYVRAHKLAESLLKGTAPPQATQGELEAPPASPAATHSLR